MYCSPVGNENMGKYFFISFMLVRPARLNGFRCYFRQLSFIHKIRNRSILGVVPSIYQNTACKSHCADVVLISSITSDLWEYGGGKS